MQPDTAQKERAPHPSDVPLLDPSILDEICDGVPGMRRAILALFADQAPGHVATIGSAVARKDLGTVHSGAHELKGASANVGASGMAHVCERLCHLTADGLAAAGAGLLTELERVAGLTLAAWGPAEAAR
jgi:HPt (histidine-containing phosphotransfer) domain-containing protein